MVELWNKEIDAGVKYSYSTDGQLLNRSMIEIFTADRHCTSNVLTFIKE